MIWASVCLSDTWSWSRQNLCLMMHFDQVWPEVQDKEKLEGGGEIWKTKIYWGGHLEKVSSWTSWSNYSNYLLEGSCYLEGLCGYERWIESERTDYGSRRQWNRHWQQHQVFRVQLGTLRANIRTTILIFHISYHNIFFHSEESKVTRHLPGNRDHNHRH